MEIKKGLFSVGSCYHSLKNLSLLDTGLSSSSSFQFDASLWKSIWNLQVIPWISLFLWKAICNAITISSNLWKRKITSQATSPICLQYEEMVEHALFHGKHAEMTWFGGTFSYCPNLNSFGSFAKWCSVRDLQNIIKKDFFLKDIVIHCRCIWNS